MVGTAAVRRVSGKFFLRMYSDRLHFLTKEASMAGTLNPWWHLVTSCSVSASALKRSFEVGATDPFKMEF